MDAETIRWILTGLMGLIMWFGKRTLDSNEQKISALQLDAAQIKANYIHKDSFKEFKDELRNLLGEIKQDIKDIKFHAS